MLANVGRISQAPAILDPQVAALAPAQLLQRLLERRELGTASGGTAREHADAPYPLALLRAPCQRPRRRRAADKRYELAPPHSITSSARASSVRGTSRLSAFAVLRLMINSSAVG